MGDFVRDQLPEPLDYYIGTVGLTLTGKGKQRQTRCDFHGGSDSMGINIETGAFLCRAGCGARGGDVLAYHMAANGLGFVEAAKALGAYREDGKPHRGSARPTPIPARDLLQSVAAELMPCAMVLSDALAGKFNDDDYDRYRAAAARVIYIAGVANA